MLTALIDYYALASKWSNENQGVVSVVIFVVTMGFGWISGIFSSLRRKPKFKLSLFDGPSFCCSYFVGKTKGEHKIHRTGIALYLAIVNVGSAASSIGNISVGYHWPLTRFSIQGLRYSVGWFWLHNQSVALADFQAKIGENIKIFPFLTQVNHLSSVKTETFLQAGQSTNGVVYFEQPDSWGNCVPSVCNDVIRVKVSVADAFGKRHVAKFSIPLVPMEYARKYNPMFGSTFAELHGEPLPVDIRT